MTTNALSVLNASAASMSALSVLNASETPSDAPTANATPASAAAVLGQADAKRRKYDFPPLQPGVLFIVCSKCHYRHLAHFKTSWRPVEMKRGGGETLWSPGLLLCQACAEFNIQLYLDIEKLKPPTA